LKEETFPLNDEQPSFSVRPAAREEYPTLIRVFNDVFHKDKDTRTLEWKYLDNPHGLSEVWVAESIEKKVVGSLAFVPRRMRIQGRDYLTLLAADGMVFPDWQRKGIFVRLLHIMFEKSWALGAPLAIAFSGRRSVKGLVRTDWDEVGLVQEWILPLRGPFLFKPIVRRAPWLAGPVGAVGDWALRNYRLKGFIQRSYTSEVKKIGRFDGALAEAGMRALEERPVYLVRDEAFLNWRYVDNPTKRHLVFGAYREQQPQGYMVMETGGGRSYVADLVALDRSVKEDLLATAVAAGLGGGGHMLHIMALEGDPMDRFLREQGFNCLPRAGLLPFMIKMGPEHGDLNPVVTDPSLWYLSHGDKDAEHMTV
jgi:hypothetical protein